MTIQLLDINHQFTETSLIDKEWYNFLQEIVDGVNDGGSGTDDHTKLINIGILTHPQLDSHVSDGTIHFTQGEISITASQVSDFDTEVSNNTDVAANTTHRTSDGSDHTFIDQDVTISSSPTFDGTNFTGMTSDNVEFPAEVGTATYDDLNDHINNIQSSGYVNGGCIISDTGTGAINIASGYGYIRATNTEIAQILPFDISAVTGLTLTDNADNYIYIDYNAGSPQYAATTNQSTAQGYDKIFIGRVYRTGIVEHIVNGGQLISDIPNRILRRINEQFGEIARVSGIILGETGTRNVTTTSGVIYAGFKRIVINSLDTSGTDTFEIFNSSASTSPDTIGVTQYDNAQYWNGSALANLLPNRYGTRFFYIDHEGDLFMQYGESNEVSVAVAENEPVPIPPTFLANFSTYIGRIVIQEGDSVASVITSAFDFEELGSVVTNHGDLAGLSDDDHTQYTLADGSRGYFTTGAGTTDNISEGSTNLYYTEARVSANTDVAANTSARHDALTVTDSAEIDFTLTGQDLTASIIASSIDETKLDTSVNASLDLADSAIQAADLSVLVPYTGATTDVDLGAFDITATDGIFTGDLGVGTVPSYKVHVKDDAVASMFVNLEHTSANQNIILKFQHNNANPGDSIIWYGDQVSADIGGQAYDHDTDSFRMWVNGSDFITVDSNQAISLKSAANEATLLNQPTGTVDLAIATTKYVDDNAGASPLTTKGDLFTYSTVDARLPVGTNDYVLTADSAEATGLKWAAAGSTTLDYELITSTTASGASSVTFTGLSSTYAKYIIEVINVKPSTDNVNFKFRTSSDNGSSYDSGASDYTWGHEVIGLTDGVNVIQYDAADSQIGFFNGMGNATNEKGNWYMEITSHADSEYTALQYYGAAENQAGSFYRTAGTGFRLSAGVVNAIEFRMDSGNINGTFKLYGVRAS